MQKYKLVLFATIMLLIAIVFSIHTRPKLKPTTILAPSSPYESAVGGIGIVEPSTENIAIGTSIAGIVNKIYVKVNQRIRAGDTLFSIDDRDTKAQLSFATAELKTANVQLQDNLYQFSLYQNVSDKRAISKDELSKRNFAVELAKAKLAEAIAKVNILNTTLDRLHVTSPINGTVLSINIRVGEYTQNDPNNPLIVLGDIDTMHVRVEVDESDAGRISAKDNAIGFLRGNPYKKINLKFVRFEPLIRTKKSLTNAANEIVDTRTLQVVYAFDNTVGAYDGEHMDVYIEGAPLRIQNK